MGVPKLFGSLLRDMPSAKGAQSNNFDILFFDLNGLIHSSYEKVLMENGISHEGVYATDGTSPDMNTFRHMVCKQVVKDIQAAVAKTSPSGVLIATDGVAPIAKITQQRKRRFLSKDFFRSQISPGTEFMSMLKDYLKENSDNIGKAAKYKKVIDENSKKLGVKQGKFPTNMVWISEDKKKAYPMIYSSDGTPGEGEAKIFKFLDFMIPGFQGSVCIHGLDADIVIRSFISRVNNIILWHEPKPDDIRGEDVFFSVPDLRAYFKSLVSKYGVFTEGVVNSVKNTKGYKNVARDQFYKNLFFLVTLIFGNDFIPKIPTFAHMLSIPYIIESLSALFHVTKRSKNFVEDITFMHVSYTDKDRANILEYNLGVTMFSIMLREGRHVRARDGEYMNDVRHKKVDISKPGSVFDLENKYLSSVKKNYEKSKGNRGRGKEDFLKPFMDMIRPERGIGDIDMSLRQWPHIMTSVNHELDIEDCVSDLIAKGWLLKDDSELGRKYIHQCPEEETRLLPRNVEGGNMMELHSDDILHSSRVFYLHIAAWTMLYYYDSRTIRDDIYYPYLQAPLAGSIYNLVNTRNEDGAPVVSYDFLMKSNQMELDISTKASLAKIIPPYSDVFPEDLLWLSSPISPISDIFPKEYSSTTLLARVSHEKSAYIPPVDVAAMNIFLSLADVTKRAK